MDNSQEKRSNEESPDNNLFSEEFDKKDVVNPSIDENEPFGEEFEKEDVVNSPEKNSDKKITPEDIDRLVAYDDERRKEISFIERSYESMGLEERELSIDEALQKNFNDFLIAPKISGDNTKPIHANRLPADHIKEGEGVVEILEDKEFLDHENEHSSVILNRSPEGELENIEILCKCGEKTLIKFDYAEDDMELTELEGKKLREELNVEADVIQLDSHEKIFSDIDEDNSEVEIVDRQEIAEPVSLQDESADNAIIENAIIENAADQEANSEEIVEDIDSRQNAQENEASDAGTSTNTD